MRGRFRWRRSMFDHLELRDYSNSPATCVGMIWRKPMAHGWAARFGAIEKQFYYQRQAKVWMMEQAMQSADSAGEGGEGR